MNDAIVCQAVKKVMPSGDRDLVVLDGIDLVVPEGQFLAILGPSGSGKSTLLGLLAGLDRPTGGAITIAGSDLGSLDEDGLAVLRRDKVGFVFQSFHLLGNLTAFENVVLPLELTGHGSPRDRARELIEAVGLSDRSHHYPSELSGGEQQRIAIARAFAPAPRILFADEPTGNLDAESGRRVLELLDQLREREGTTVVLVTHDEGVARRAERRLRFAEGRIVSDEREAETTA